MTAHTCPVEGCEYGEDEEKSMAAVRSHINAKSDPEHDWATLKPVVEGEADDEPAPDRPDEVEEVADALADEGMEVVDRHGTVATPDEQDDDTDDQDEDMGTDQEYQQQQERAEGGESGDDDDADEPDTGGAGAGAGGAAAAAGAGLIGGISPWIVVGIVLLGVLALVLYAGGDGGGGAESAPSAMDDGESTPDAATGESGQQGGESTGAERGGGLVADGGSE